MHTQTSNNIFEELVLSVLPLLKKKAHKARTRWYRGPFRRFFFKYERKRNEQKRYPPPKKKTTKKQTNTHTQKKNHTKNII